MKAINTMAKMQESAIFLAQIKRDTHPFIPVYWKEKAIKLIKET
ncbi:hypothetical protein [Domibacillus tundrae]